MTSGSTAAAQKYWEFLKYVYNTNHLWATNVLSVNLDAWNELSPEHQAAIEELAAKMEPEFWAVSEGEHGIRMKQLEENGMVISAPSEAVLAAMREATASMADEFAARVPGSGEVIAEFKKRTGKGS